MNYCDLVGPSHDFERFGLGRFVMRRLTIPTHTREPTSTTETVNSTKKPSSVRNMLVIPFETTVIVCVSCALRQIRHYPQVYPRFTDVICLR